MLRGFYIITLTGLLFFSCNEYRRGDVYTQSMDGDSLVFVITASGLGSKISAKAYSTKLELEYKGDSCRIIYLTDSISLHDKKGVLLQNTMLPGMKEDMLAKGYIGTFTSKQMVTMLLVSFEDFEKYLKEGSPKK